jgi:hypothetical protein
MVETSLQYLTRDELYKTEKPYSAEFEIPVDSGAQKTNYILTKRPVMVHAIPPTNSFTLNPNGFCVVNEKTQLGAAKTLANPETVESAYLQQLAAILARRFSEYTRL